MERVRKSLKNRSWRKVITYFLTCCLFLNTSLPVALAEVVYQPGHVDNRGVITVTPDTVDPFKTNMTAEDGAIGHFSDFDIATGHFVDCVQPSSDASALFRIFSGDGTQIQGRFDANGSIYLIDPAGILFDAGHEINVNRLIASGLNMSNDAFDAVLEGGEMVFSGGNGEVRNQGGEIRANDLYLIGQKVLNNGKIIAPGGLVVMAAGEQVTLAQDGSNVSVVVSDIGYSLDIRNSNIVSANNGKIVLAAGDTFSRAISNVSYIDASGGEVSMKAAIVENRGRIFADASTVDGDGGSISLIGTEEVVIGPDKLDNTSYTFADAGANGNGGTITIKAGTDTVEGNVTIEENSLITATGGSVSGNGGEVTITCDNFEIAGDIDASFGNKISGEEVSKPGKLEITASSSATDNVTIADGANAGAMNTIYEDDIEALSKAGTSLIVNAEKGITVKNITDGLDPGEISGQFGSIELHATGENSAVTFADVTDTIRTTLGDIVIEAGSGGITAGNLITGKDMAAQKPAVGQIILTTENGGDITTGNLLVENGWRHAEINVNASGNLTVDGNVKIGSESAILNVPPQASAEAMIYLSAGDNVVLNGEVYADAHGIEEAEDTTKAYIEILAGGDAEINGDLFAEAKSSNNGIADAVIKIEVVGDVVFDEGVEVHAIADGVAVEAIGPKYEDDEAFSEDDPPDHAQIIIDDSAIVLEDDNFSTAKSAVDIVLDVLLNDTLEGEVTIDSFDIDPTAGSLTIEDLGDKTVLIYNPPEDLSTLTFDENGEATVTFTYTVEGNTATGTITLTNGLPVAVDDLATTFKDQAINISVLTNDTDPDLDDVLTVVAGTITTKHGTLVLNEDGTFTYTPDEGFIGDDSFTYTVTDSFNTSSEVEVKITVSEEPPTPPALPYIQPAPGLERMRIEIEVSGCPALVKWAAEEIGIDQRLVQIWVANSLASTGNIQPCDACEGLKNAAKILQDADGTHIAALAQVINEFASSTAPPTEEQMASIADAITRNTDEDSYYAVADEYLDALAMYVGILSSEMGFSAIESVQLVTDKYVGQLAQGQNVGVATFIAASLAALGG